ncbi:hypothetical protein K439DRAFT_1337615, partial [Ramaria rubella]
VEVGTQFACRWRVFFARLEHLHSFDHQSSSHLWLLHLLFLDMINEDCNDFQETWNHHPILGLGTHDMSPAELCFFGETISGKQTDEFTEIHPDILNRYCSTHGKERLHKHGDTGAGNPLDEASTDSEGTSGSEEADSETEDTVSESSDRNIKHDAVKVAHWKNPFAHNPELEASFQEALEAALQDDAVPEHLYVWEEEWESGEYPTHKALKCGSKGRELIVELPLGIWLPRAVAWAQALFLMTDFMLQDNQ